MKKKAYVSFDWQVKEKIVSLQWNNFKFWRVKRFNELEGVIISEFGNFIFWVNSNYKKQAQDKTSNVWFQTSLQVWKTLVTYMCLVCVYILKDDGDYFHIHSLEEKLS